MEPRELGNVPAEFMTDFIPLQNLCAKAVQLSLFADA